jgi:hypothetical protein
MSQIFSKLKFKIKKHQIIIIFFSDQDEQAKQLPQEFWQKQLIV